MRVLVCGGRDFTDYNLLTSTLNQLEGITHLIHGEAKGADTLARLWAKDKEIVILGYPANWHRDGEAARPIRNQRMLNQGEPDLVIAFPGGKGTADMVRRAKLAG